MLDARQPEADFSRWNAAIREVVANAGPQFVAALDATMDIPAPPDPAALDPLDDDPLAGVLTNARRGLVLTLEHLIPTTGLRQLLEHLTEVLEQQVFEHRSRC